MRFAYIDSTAVESLREYKFCKQSDRVVQQPHARTGSKREYGVLHRLDTLRLTGTLLLTKRRAALAWVLLLGIAWVDFWGIDALLVICW